MALIQENLTSLEEIHNLLARHLKIEEYINKSYKANGTEYELALKELLELDDNLQVKNLDANNAQNTPDLLLKFKDKAALIECKTTQKDSIKKEDAFSITHKASDYDSSFARISLVKPNLEKNIKEKAQNNLSITLLEHNILIEGFLRLLSKSISTDEFFEWITQPGLTQIKNLKGDPTHKLLIDIIHPKNML